MRYSAEKIHNNMTHSSIGATHSNWENSFAFFLLSAFSFSLAHSMQQRAWVPMGRRLRHGTRSAYVFNAEFLWIDLCACVAACPVAMSGTTTAPQHCAYRESQMKFEFKWRLNDVRLAQRETCAIYHCENDKKKTSKKQTTNTRIDFGSIENRCERIFATQMHLTLVRSLSDVVILRTQSAV